MATFYKVDLAVSYTDKTFLYKDLGQVGVLLHYLIEGSTDPVEIRVQKVEKNIEEVKPWATD